MREMLANIGLTFTVAAVFGLGIIAFALLSLGVAVSLIPVR